jgi:hypothetical protein
LAINRFRVEISLRIRRGFCGLLTLESEEIMKPTNQSQSDKSKTLHPGSSAEDAKHIGGKGDFGVPESDVIERQYTSQNTKHSDRGAAVPRAGSEGQRVSGVGGNDSGPGSSSGGDVDTDIIGIRGGNSTDKKGEES